MATMILRDTHRALEQKMKELEKQKKETSIKIREAASHGDLKENGEYSDARVLTLKEILILSGLPDNWKAPEWASENMIREVIGEGVPPRLIESILANLDSNVS